ncbi:glycerol-3-phosphate dehydrogenase [Shewanella inventionis]|uniref:Glycerol-3-phosphate dehydrogenase n=1 Tax=Shewanella inventionis TaxID=1738770 RepID=A0ABQ1JGB2_9GAMM|nr:glycerol-3-phosphate dehydrogenase [Shewanella inventionis]MCL1158096.1 glycerol-3-phosphate dehydrogenase [Shewanella inventionis]GGB65304.1 glycerol-3-phosphate dehydrogenase [Shewanella inventionis]
MEADIEIVDVVVIGGGINGVGIAADAVGRGLSVLLCEQNDLASATSSNSSKLIHGGLRYLEHYEFRLVKEALAEREVLLKKAPHLITPLTFRLPHQAHLRPAWMIRLGLFLYDNLASRVTLSGSKKITFGVDSPLKPSFIQGFEYSDAWVDDSRLVVLNALAAKELGAQICTQTRCINAEREGALWRLTLQNQADQSVRDVLANTVVNASGPWVSSLFSNVIKQPSPQKIRLVKGSHIVVPKIHQQPQAYILQNEDQRIVFVIPFEDDFSLIGTTDVDFNGDPKEVKIDQQEIDYLVNITNHYFNTAISEQDIVHTFSGVRPLMDDESESAQSVTRDYTFIVDAPKGKAALLSVFGGKITTYRKLAEAAVNRLKPFHPKMGKAWTAQQVLPGGDFSNLTELTRIYQQQYQWLAPKYISRLLRTYGARTQYILNDATSEDALGIDFGHGLYQAEVDYLMTNEWACTGQDVLWRRTKLGLHFSAEQQQHLSDYMQAANAVASDVESQQQVG